MGACDGSGAHGSSSELGAPLEGAALSSATFPVAMTVSRSQAFHAASQQPMHVNSRANVSTREDDDLVEADDKPILSLLLILLCRESS